MIDENLKYNQRLKMVDNKDLEITKRIIPFNDNEGSLAILFIKQLVDNNMLSETVIKPILKYTTTKSKSLDAQLLLDKILYSSDCKINDDDNVMKQILLGQVVIIFTTDDDYLTINLKQIEHRSIDTPKIAYTLRGPKDCFVENFDVNFSLLRNRVKDDNLKIKTFELGRRTKTRVAVFYIQDIASDTVVNELQKRIENIDVDGIYESGELQAFLLNKKSNLFPQMGIVERSDHACRLLLEGRVVTIVEGSNMAISAPMTFSDFFVIGDDYYDNKYLTIFMRTLRYLALFLAFAGTSVYVALTSFAYSALPGNYVVLLAQMHAMIPYPAIFGAFLLELLMEIIRESLLRVPQNIGPAVGIVGAIVIGQAAIASEIFSPILLMVASLALLSSFVVSDYTLMNVFRILKFLLLIATGVFGFFGFTLFLCVVLINIVSINSFGVPYAAPFAPFKLKGFGEIFMQNRSINKERPEYLRNKDNKRE